MSLPRLQLKLDARYEMLLLRHKRMILLRHYRLLNYAALSLKPLSGWYISELKKFNNKIYAL